MKKEKNYDTRVPRADAIESVVGWFLQARDSIELEASREPLSSSRFSFRSSAGTDAKITGWRAAPSIRKVGPLTGDRITVFGTQWAFVDSLHRLSLLNPVIAVQHLLLGCLELLREERLADRDASACVNRVDGGFTVVLGQGGNGREEGRRRQWFEVNPGTIRVRRVLDLSPRF